MLTLTCTLTFPLMCTLTLTLACTLTFTITYIGTAAVAGVGAGATKLQTAFQDKQSQSWKLNPGTAGREKGWRLTATHMHARDKTWSGATCRSCVHDPRPARVQATAGKRYLHLHAYMHTV